MGFNGKFKGGYVYLLYISINEIKFIGLHVKRKLCEDMKPKQ